MPDKKGIFDMANQAVPVSEVMASEYKMPGAVKAGPLGSWGYGFIAKEAALPFIYTDPHLLLMISCFSQG